MKSKKILIVCLTILAIIAIINLFMYRSKSEQFTPSSKLTKIFGAGTADTSVCSVTTCGLTGTQYRNFSCTYNNAAVDPGLCFGTGALASLQVSCTAAAGTCDDGVEESVYAWKLVNTIDAPVCAYDGYTYNQITTAKCVDLTGAIVADSFCSTLGTAPASTTTLTAGPSTRCLVTTGDSIGLQNYHYQLNGVLNDAYSLLGGGYSGSGGMTSQVVKYVSPGNKLTLPVSGTDSALNGTNTKNVNTLYFPKGLAGYFYVMLFYPLKSSATAITITATVETQTSIQIPSVYFKTVMNNTSASSTKLFYYILPVLIKDDSVKSYIKFSCSSALSNISDTQYADLFVLQAGSFTNSVCGNITTKQFGYYGLNCYLGGLPLMARYKFSGHSASKPFGTVSNLYLTDNQMSDTIGLSFTEPTSGSVTVTIPTMEKYTQIASGTSVNYIIMINWIGSTAVTTAVTFTGNTGGSYGDSAFKPFGYTITGGVGSSVVTNKGESSRFLFYATTLTLNVGVTSSFTISGLTPPTGSGTTNGDLVIIQYTGSL